MFELVKNNFISGGVCHYEDEYGNKAVIRRTGDISFSAKIRFKEANIKATPIRVDVEKVIKDGLLGDSLHLDYAPDANIETESVTAGISAFSELLQYWIALFSDLRFSWCNNNLLLKGLKADNSAGSWYSGVFGDAANATEMDIYAYKYNLLKNYKELEPVLMGISKED